MARDIEAGVEPATEKDQPGRGKTVAIVQSSYIPWKGYFDLIAAADEFILLDSVQFTRRDWRSRNRIKTQQGLRWLTIPVETAGGSRRRIDEVRVADPGWAARHWKTITYNYARAPHFGTYADRLERLFLDCGETRLSEVNARFIRGLCALLGIETRLSWSSDYGEVAGKTERLVHLCSEAGATRYLSGGRARDYIDPDLFEQAGIELSYFDYAGYPEYDQLHPPFEHQVSVIDLLLNAGPEAPRYLKWGSPASASTDHAAEGLTTT